MSFPSKSHLCISISPENPVPDLDPSPLLRQGGLVVEPAEPRGPGDARNLALELEGVAGPEAGVIPHWRHKVKGLFGGIAGVIPRARVQLAKAGKIGKI